VDIDVALVAYLSLVEVAGIVGGVGLLKAVGFRKVGDSLELALEARDMDLLVATRAKIQAALTACSLACPHSLQGQLQVP
jgi:hypothetical protein